MSVQGRQIWLSIFVPTDWLIKYKIKAQSSTRSTTQACLLCLSGPALLSELAANVISPRKASGLRYAHFEPHNFPIF